MKRRKFLQYTSAGFGVSFISPGFSHISKNRNNHKGNRPLQVEFVSYRKGKTLCPIQIISPSDAPYMHTFYDVQPFSPCQRYLVLTRLPYQFKAPPFGDTADVCVLDLELRTLKTIYTTKAWGTQVGSNVQWGNDSRFVYTNDWIGKQYVCVRIDLETDEIHAFSGPMYHISPDANYIAGFLPDYINLTQMGYGAPSNPEFMPELYTGAPNEFGLFQTNLKTNESKLLMGLSRFKPYYGDKLADGTFYLFHTKYNAHSDRIMQVVRFMVPDSKAWNPSLFTFDLNGNDLKQAITMEQWSQGGNHPNWHPDGRRIVMNLRSKESFGKEEMLMVMFNQDGSEMKALTMRNGSGHPSVTPDTRYLLTDAYAHPREKEFINNDGEVKIRLIDLRSDKEEAICYVYVPPVPVYGSQRIDPHPVWSRDYKKVIFAGAPQGKRETFIADLSNTI